MCCFFSWTVLCKNLQKEKAFEKLSSEVNKCLDSTGFTKHTTTDTEREEIIEGEEEVFSLLYTGTNPIMATAGERINMTVIPQHQNGTVTYQWYQITPDKSLLSLPWETNDTIVFESVTVQDAGNYQCMATDMVANSAQSPIITLVVDSGMPLCSLTLLFLPRQSRVLRR